MTTLAQDYVDHARLKPDVHENRTLCHQMLLEALSPAKADTPVVTRQRKAEVFVFDENPTEVVDSLVVGGHIESRLVYETARLPADVVWIEYPANLDVDPKCRIGILIAKDAIGAKGRKMAAVCFVMRSTKYVGPFGMLALDRFPLDPKDEFAIAFWRDIEPGMEWGEGTLESIKAFMWDLFDSLFLIMTPRVCEVRHSEHSPRLQSRRVKSGKLPLVEYKKMILRVGIGQPRYVKHAGDPSELCPGDAPGGQRRRLHSVIGHFRTYQKGREMPLATFVPQHWRGDPEQGIVLRERHVKKD